MCYTLIMRLCFPRNRYLASILLRLHKLDDPDIEWVFKKYQVTFDKRTVYVKSKLFNRRRNMDEDKRWEDYRKAVKQANKSYKDYEIALKQAAAIHKSIEDSHKK